LCRIASHVVNGSFSTELGRPVMSGLTPTATEEPTFQFGSFVPFPDIAPGEV